MEVALSGAPALFVPMEEGGEQEQLLRARAFARSFPDLGCARIGDLTPEALAARVQALAARPRRPAPLRADGAAEAARIILSEL